MGLRCETEALAERNRSFLICDVSRMTERQINAKTTVAGRTTYFCSSHQQGK
jgi:hypothetical protein